MIDFGLCMMLTYGDKLKDFPPKLKKLVDSINFHHCMYKHSVKYMKSNFSLIYLEDAYEQYQRDLLFQKKTILKINIEKL
jgi:hypothetical protein